MIYIFLVLFFSFSAQAQQKTYYTVDWEETTEEQAHYYRLTSDPRPKDSLIHVQDFYVDGTIRSDGYVTTLKYYDNYSGRYEDYYANGQLRYFVNYDSTTLKKTGESIWYTSAGDILAKGIYEDGYGVDGLTRNNTYAARFMNMNADTLVSRINFYNDSKQIGEEFFYRKVPQYGTDRNGAQVVNYWYRLKEVVYYDRKGKEIGRLQYQPNEMIDSGTQIFFYKNLDFNLTIKTILHYTNKKAEGEEVSYKPDGRVWLTGINKNDHHFEGQFLDGDDIISVKNGQIQQIDFFNRFGDFISTLKYKNGKKWEGLDPAIFINDIYKDGKRVERIEYVDARKDKIKFRKFYQENEDYIVQWYDLEGKKLGKGTYRDGQILKGLDVIYRMDYVIFSCYKNGEKNGIEKLKKYNGTILSEKKYKNNLVVKDKTLNPLTGKMVKCIYKNGRAYKGVFWELEEEFIFEEGYLIQKNEYDYPAMKRLLTSTFYEKTAAHHIVKVINFHNDGPEIILYKEGRAIRN